MTLKPKKIRLKYLSIMDIIEVRHSQEMLLVFFKSSIDIRIRNDAEISERYHPPSDICYIALTATISISVLVVQERRK